MGQRKSKRKPRQLALAEQGQGVPVWATLPEECRREVVELLARLLSNEIAAAAEVDDD